MTAAIDITAGQRKTLLALLRRYIPGVAVWAYGSRVKWTARPNSDLDLVAFTTPEQQPIVSELKEAFAESDLSFLVDFHVWDQVPERFHEIIRKEYVVLQEQQKSCSDIPGWKYITLGDFVALQRGHDLTEPERRPGHVPVIGSAGQNGFHDTALAKGPGIVIGRSGASFGQVHFCETEYWPHNTGLYVTDFKGNDPRFAFYFLKALDFDRYNSGSAQPSLNRNFIYPIPICVPEPDEQKAIAHILGTLDDKIELNRRMNATLEAMARALFQSWFVDFDPVRAKLDGRQPAGLDAATAALFPAHFQDSPLGHIPQGWSVTPLGDVVDVVKGRSYRSEELAESKTALVTLKSFLRGGGYRADGLKPFIGEYKPNQRVSAGDLVVAFTDVTQAADVIGKPALVSSDERFENLVASLDVGIVRPKSECVSIPFLYCLFLTEGFQAHTYSHATGTTVLHLSPTAIPSFQCTIPNRELAIAFARYAEPLFRLIDENAKHSRTLATIRDALLPKLLSGEMSVAQAESEQEAVI